jgi:eukaryotic-like serine/threonine-protein kinase
LAVGDEFSNHSGMEETQGGGNSASDAATSAGSASQTTPVDTTYIGSYRLIRKVGEGGMGQVWLAEQTAPVRRQVALKLLKGGWYDADVTQRFESERQTLAVMDHPAIAKVFDAGSTPEGRPFFVMEYVAGLPITAYCDQHQMATRRRLELFVLVCEGVQHAHQKSIIHRDLKPSNILVNETDGVPTPRIIDFGIAKATSQEGGADQTVMTKMGALIGTPDYMSPEQSDPSVSDIDSRTDVYSLGVVLYEMITGCLPFAAPPGQKRRLDEVLRQLREVDPPTPSVRLYKDSPTLTASAAARGITPKQLVSQLRGDLDWITMKALEKSRARRYATPSELAADVRRFLADEPILARPPSAAYQMAKFARRNRILVAGIAAVLLALIAGVTASTILAIRATRARTLAELRRVQTDQARTIAVEREKEAMTARQLAERRETEAEAARNSALEARAAEARQRAAAEQNEEQARKETLEAETNFQLARDAVDNYFTKVSESRELKAQNLEKLRRELLVTARDFYQKFVNDRAGDALLKADLGGAMFRLGRADMQIGENTQSEQSLTRAAEILETSFREHPDNPAIADNLFSTYAGLGLLYLNTNQFVKAEQSYDKAALFMESWRKTHSLAGDQLNRLADLYDSFGSLLLRAGKTPEATDACSKALAIRQELVRQSPGNDDYKIGLIMTDSNMTGVLAGANKVEAALPFAQNAVSTGEALYAGHPSDPDISNRLAASYNNLGGLYTLLGRNDDAEKAHRRSMELRETLVAEHPAIVEYSIRLVSSYINLGELAQRRNDSSAALNWLKKAEQALQGVLAKEPRQSIARYYLSYDYSWQARAYETQGNHKQSVADWEQAIQYDDHNDPTLRAGKALALAEQGDAPAACALADQLVAQNPRTDTLFELAGVYAISAAALSGKDANAADADGSKSIALLNRVSAAGYFRVPEQLEQLKTGRQFTAIRTRDDYKQMIATINSSK